MATSKAQSMNKRMVAVVVSALVIVGALGVVVGRQWGSVPTPTTSEKATTTLGPAAQPAVAIWPFASTVTRFGDPVLAAQAFATAYLGFVNPIVGKFQQGDSRSGEVPVRATPTGAVTTILVRQLTSENSWWVLGASCPDITVTPPLSSERISSPVEIRGRSTAFEAVVNVEVRQDGTLAPLKTDTVMGGSMGVIGPFKKSISFALPSSRAGALLFRTLSAKDGHVIEASVIRVTLQK
jgi:hypothetical protein